MSDTTANATPQETVTKTAATIRTNKVLSFPRNLARDLDALKEKGCEVSYERGAQGALTEVFHDVRVSGPADVVNLFWAKIGQDLGMKVLDA